jgi:hypothetical protein
VQRGQKLLELPADDGLRRRDGKGQDAPGTEVTLGETEKFKGIKPVDLGCGRLWQVEEDDLVFFLGFLEKGPSVLKDDADPGIVQVMPLLLSQEAAGEVDDLGIELDIIDFRAAVFEKLSECTSRASAEKEDAPGFGILKHGKMDGLLGRCRVGQGIEGRVITI